MHGLARQASCSRSAGVPITARLRRLIPSSRITLILATATAAIGFLNIGVSRNSSRAGLMWNIATGQIELPGGLELSYRWLLMGCVLVSAARLALGRGSGAAEPEQIKSLRQMSGIEPQAVGGDDDDRFDKDGNYVGADRDEVLCPMGENKTDPYRNSSTLGLRKPQDTQEIKDIICVALEYLEKPVDDRARQKVDVGVAERVITPGEYIAATDPRTRLAEAGLPANLRFSAVEIWDAALRMRDRYGGEITHWFSQLVRDRRYLREVAERAELLQRVQKQCPHGSGYAKPTSEPFTTSFADRQADITKVMSGALIKSSSLRAHNKDKLVFKGLVISGILTAACVRAGPGGLAPIATATAGVAFTAWCYYEEQIAIVRRISSRSLSPYVETVWLRLPLWMRRRLLVLYQSS